ncbi:protein SODIUM POTASSIUM ROOT DEFECTIVE 1-like [Silene latifolia]|uniref:protein SODIUM POTASSIUM ROOT DEFECTIVE 1-like n=1 Tax=Silene latifolia TaxID=37657 RepID=UPI003D77B44E
MLNITPCTSQNSTSIFSSTMDIPSSSSSSSSTFMAGGRTLDRHNPIITDEKRSGISSNPGTPIGTPRTHHVLQQKPKTPTSPISTPTTRKKKNKTTSRDSRLNLNKNTTKVTILEPEVVVDYNNNSNSNNNSNNNDDDDDLSESIMKAAAIEISRPSVDYVSPPESSRYLLDDTSFLDVLSGFDPVLKLDPDNDTKNSDNNVEVSHEFDGLSKPTKNSSSVCPSSDQVVVLRVSLHCRGCERKMKKHLSRMSGVTSFNIDFAAKKVTVVGDVTPLQVLASISKVKTAKLWSPTIPSSSHINATIVEPSR